MQIGFDFAEKDGMLPLPATLVRALGQAIAKDHPGSEVRLLSNYRSRTGPQARSSTSFRARRWQR